jgi:hypothetical protein
MRLCTGLPASHHPLIAFLSAEKKFLISALMLLSSKTAPGILVTKSAISGLLRVIVVLFRFIILLPRTVIILATNEQFEIGRNVDFYSEGLRGLE